MLLSRFSFVALNFNSMHVRNYAYVMMELRS